MIDFGVATGNVVASETEEEIFRILGTFPVIKFFLVLWIVKNGQVSVSSCSGARAPVTGKQAVLHLFWR